MLSDLEIAQAATIRPILDIAREIGLNESEIEPYGWYKAKVHLVRQRLQDRPDKYIDVTAITPTPLGEEKPPPPWAEPGTGRPSGQGLYLHSSTLYGADLWHQGGCGRRRLLADHPHGGL